MGYRRRMGRGGAVLLRLLVATGLGGCTPPATPPLVDEPPPAAAPPVEETRQNIAVPAPVPTPVPDPVYQALAVERSRQGLGAELEPLLGKNVDAAAKVSAVFSGAPKSQIPDDRGGTFRLWRREGEPWILRVDANGTIIAYDVPTQGIAGRRPAVVTALRGERKAIVEGLDDMIGLPIDSFTGESFNPIDTAKLRDGKRIYTFRTPDDYFLSLGTDPNGVITGWSSDVPGIARPLRAPPAAKPPVVKPPVAKR